MESLPTVRPQRVRRGVALLGVVTLLVAACSEGTGGGAATSTPSAGSGSPASAAGPTSAEGASAAFPVAIEHKYSSTEILDEPERVLSLGYQEHDTIFALGVEPVAVRYWYGDQDDVIFPWAEDAAGDADPEILNMPDGNLSVEVIAALDPDLILGVYSGITEDEYATLSRIAPTVAQPGEFVDYGTPWQDSTYMIGAALGRSAQADVLVQNVEDRFEAVRESHPEWDGQSVVVATYGEDGLGFFASEDPRSRFFTSLGFEVPAELDDLAGERFYGDISFEEGERLDVDVLVWDQVNFTEGGRATVESDPLLAQLGVSTEGRTVFVGGIEDAFAWNSVLSLPVALGGLVPMLERATDGDPSTDPSPTS